MEIQFKELFEKDLSTGVNLFTGAGFSIYARDKNGENLPVAGELTQELINKFNCPPISDLSKVCTIIDSYDSDGLRNYLISRFDVDTFDSEYFNILNINFQRVYTTNIDNLFSKIIENSGTKYLNNVFKNGASFNDTNCIDYHPVHGSIEFPDDKFIFNTQEVSTSFGAKRNAWGSLSNASQQIPTLFIGYSFNDAGAIEALWGKDTNSNNHKNKWIVLRNNDQGAVAYFKALGFKIIISELKEFLLYLGKFNASNNLIKKDSTVDYLLDIFPEAAVPSQNSKLKVRTIDEFFLGDAPIWTDVLSNRVHPTSHLDQLLNLSEKDKHIVVTGIPASGKSTLMLQLAVKLSKTHRVAIFSDLISSKANIIKNEVKVPTIIIVDNFTNDIDAFVILESNKNIKLIGFERFYNVDISMHKLRNKYYIFYDISELTPQDIQSIYNTIPLTIRKPKLTRSEDSTELISIFEFVNYNIVKPSLQERYIPILQQLDERNDLLLDLLVMTCYLHSCRVPVSFEVANSFLSYDTDSYIEVFDLMNSLKGMINEVVGDIIDDSQDYYQPRSQILAETIISQTKTNVFRRVFIRFHECVSKHQIPKYYIFKRSGYDASYTTKAFTHWEDGLKFYEDVFEYEGTPFVLQQCALYLLKKRRYTEAALKIDRALQISKKRIFSIENTHAIILFKANIDTARFDDKAISVLDRSMNILMECYNDDKRKIYHAITFAEQALDYISLSNNEKAISYLSIALKWLIAVDFERNNHIRVKSLINRIKMIL